MKRFANITTACFLLLLFAAASCRKEDLDGPLPANLGGDTWTKSAIDKWLYDSLTKPFNIEVKYRWDPWEVQLDKTLVPPDESKVIPTMQAVRQIWIEPYTKETGSETFIKTYAPKQFVLVGSPQYDFGTILLGRAEGGKKIALYTINNFEKSNIIELKRMLHTIEHEFAHILHQTILYPVEYKRISTGYTATWFNISEEEARENGFITAYSMADPNEDFVEMIATMLVQGKSIYEQILSTISNAKARADLKRKEEIVVAYFKQAWNIDFYSLQQRTQEALFKLVGPPPSISDYFGFEKAFTSILINPVLPSLLPQSTEFGQAYDAARKGMENAGKILLDTMFLSYTSANTVLLEMYYWNAARDSLFGAAFVFTVSIDAGGVYTFTYTGASAQGVEILSAVAPLIDYFNKNKFRLDWFKSPNEDYRLRARFSPQQNPAATLVGLLL